MKSTLVTSVDQLKKICRNEETMDFAIQLNGGAFSRKEIFYHNEGRWKDDNPVEYDAKYLNKFEVTNCIDGTTQILSEEDIINDDLTNIGKAMRQNAFFHLEYD